MSKLILGDGLLGSELVKQTGWNYISRKKDGIDFTDDQTYRHFLSNYNEIINCIAHTDTYDKSRNLHWNINYKAVSDLVEICNKYNKKLIHISSDYVYSNSNPGSSEGDVPVHCNNWYGYTKLLGDAHVQLKSNNYLIVRCGHKQSPFPYEKAYVNLIGNFDYVDIITKYIVKLIDKNAVGIYNIGTDVKTVYQLAKRTSSDVKPMYSMIDDTAPTNVVMDVSKLERFLKEK